MYFHYIYFHYLFYFHLFPRKIVHFPYSQWQLFMHRPPYAYQNSLYVLSFETHEIPMKNYYSQVIDEETGT